MKKALTTLITLLLGSLVTFAFITTTGAHGGDASLLHGCVGTGVLNQGRVRIISANSTCNANEAPHDWKEYNLADEIPLICPDCSFVGLVPLTQFVNKNLSNALLKSANFNSTEFTGTNFTNANLEGAGFAGTYSNINFTGANLTNSQIGSSFTNSNFSNANVQGVAGGDTDYSSSNFTGANFTNSGLLNSNFNNTNLTNVNFTGSNLQGAVNMSTATRTGIIWSNTSCPDGTNSDNNGNTCEGHL